MALILWNSKYSVGIDALDADHIMIFSLINHLDEAKRFGSDESAIGCILDALIKFARGHFRREEKLLAEYGYPELERHKEAHRLLEEQLKDLHEEYQRTPNSETSQEIMELVAFWLDEHILNVDMRYKDYLQTTIT